jgi:hypothetical protein
MRFAGGDPASGDDQDETDVTRHRGRIGGKWASRKREAISTTHVRVTPRPIPPIECQHLSFKAVGSPPTET